MDKGAFAAAPPADGLLAVQEANSQQISNKRFVALFMVRNVIFKYNGCYELENLDR